jgi:hypothetical protein
MPYTSYLYLYLILPGFDPVDNATRSVNDFPDGWILGFRDYTP